MKELFKLRTILCWIICIGSYWVTAALYPYNFYYGESYIPEMTFVELLILMGITALLGTGMHLLMQLVCALGKWIGMKKNLVFYFLYHFVICSLFAFTTDKLIAVIKIEPDWLYLLLGFFPAVLCSIVYSYHVSHKPIDTSETK